MSRLKNKYQQETMLKLKEEFNIKNNLAVPSFKKIVINIGVGDAKDNQGILDNLLKNLTTLSGQKPVVTKAKKSISSFKLSKGASVGMMVTLRGERMYDFFDKLVSVVLPKVRDFRGVRDTSFDNQGNFTLGLKEQAIFPEVSFEDATTSRTRGLEISIITSAKDKVQGKKLLELLGMPFKKG